MWRLESCEWVACCPCCEAAAELPLPLHRQCVWLSGCAAAAHPAASGWLTQRLSFPPSCSCEIGDGVRLSNCVILNRVTVKKYARVADSIIGWSSKRE